MRRRDAGFTTLEAIVALVLFTIVATSTALVVNNSIRTSSLSQLRVAASAIAQEQLNAVRAQPTAANSTSVQGLGQGHQFTAEVTVQACTEFTREVHIDVLHSSDDRFLARTDSVISC